MTFKDTGLDLLITTIVNNINNSDTGKTKSHSNLVQKYTKTVTFFIQVRVWILCDVCDVKINYYSILKILNYTIITWFIITLFN